MNKAFVSHNNTNSWAVNHLVTITNSELNATSPSKVAEADSVYLLVLLAASKLHN